MPNVDDYMDADDNVIEFRVVPLNHVADPRADFDNYQVIEMKHRPDKMHGNDNETLENIPAVSKGLDVYDELGRQARIIQACF